MSGPRPSARRASRVGAAAPGSGAAARPDGPANAQPFAHAGAARPCLVLLPGTLCDAALFRAQVRDLRGRATVRCVDLHGLGAHAGQAGDWTDALLRELPPRFSLVGFSLGGLLALEILRRAPERVERLALVASNAEAATRRARRRGQAQQLAWRQGGGLAVVRRLLPLYLPVPRRRARHAPVIQRMARETPTAAALAQFDWAARRPDGHAVLAAHPAPLLVVSGADDRLCPRALQQRVVATRADAHWVELRRCGHFIPLEQPRQLSRLLAQWLAAPARGEPGDPA
jgi:pimeloyl-ACP methyl ester carboxylesterase